MGFMLESFFKFFYIFFINLNFLLPWLNMPKYGQKRAKK